MNGFNLFVQVKITLVFLHLALHPTTDFFIDIENVDLAFDLLKKIFESLLDAGQIKHGLLVLKLERQMRSDGVCQTTRVINAGDRGQYFGRNFFIQFDVLVKLLHHGTPQGFDFAGFAAQRGLGFIGQGHGRERGGEVRLAFLDIVDMGPLLPFDQHLDRAIG